MAWLVNGLGLLLILFVIGWFWVNKPRLQQAQAAAVIEIIVDGGVYDPARIEVPRGQATTLRFIRRDASPCAEKVIFNGLGVSAELPLDEPRNLDVTPPQSGEYEFTCQMGMYRGVLVVK
ncbi:MAG: cupredoxin domain-containing protein [Gammaproteobacteria bacterium]|nr:cupredoxin domain-containing protein [Gammaproteobacteria bacterium]